MSRTDVSTYPTDFAIDTVGAEEGNMGRKSIDQKYEKVILHVLYEQDPGASVGNFDNFFKLGGSRFDPRDKQRVLDIMGGHAGLFEQGFITGLPLSGNNPGMMPVDMRGIALTAEGKKYVEDHSLSARTWILLKWLVTTTAGGLIAAFSGGFLTKLGESVFNELFH